MAANLRRRAAQQARRASLPARRAARNEIRGVRQDTAATVRSLNSMGQALDDSLDQARRNARSIGLSGDDLKMMLRELAMRETDVAAGTQLQIQQARRSGLEDLQAARAGLTDVADAEAAARLDLLGQMRAQRAERREQVADRRADVAGDIRGFILDQLGESGVPGLAGGSSGGGGGAGMTPTQKRDKAASRENAQHWALEVFRQSKEDPEGPSGGPAEWSDSDWDALTSAVLKQEGVSDVADARWAVSRIRENVTGEQLQDAGPMGQNPGYHGDLEVPGAKVETPIGAPPPTGPMAVLSSLAQQQAIPGLNPDLLRQIVTSLGLR